MTLRRGLTIVAALALVTLGGVMAYGWSNGYRAYGVESGSMSPAFHTGDLVIDTPTTAATTYRVGDVITFHPTPAYTTTHRILSIDATGMSTKGDANLSSDLGQVEPSMVVGRVAFVVPFGGYLAAFFRQPAGIAATLLLLVLVYVLWELAIGRKTPTPARPDSAATASNSAGEG